MRSFVFVATFALAALFCFQGSAAPPTQKVDKEVGKVVKCPLLCNIVRCRCIGKCVCDIKNEVKAEVKNVAKEIKKDACKKDACFIEKKHFRKFFRRCCVK